MANIFNENNKVVNEKGYEAQANNATIPAQIETGAKVFFWILVILTLGIVWLVSYIGHTNYFNRQQNTINNLASTVDTQLAKRADTLVKLADSTKGYLKHEKGVLENIAALRSASHNLANSSAINANEASQLSQQRQSVESGMNTMWANLMGRYENYPELKADKMVQELMEQSSYLEAELAASRRLYNTEVNRFNQDIMSFPKSYRANKMKLVTIPLFQASTIQRQDVKINLN
ncbi:LemA family protein [Mycoplasmopsis lipofaciens]|uniref:LemA family protein n=1 Tax=Mycoplasmopsis lipofaciens TaxID=114884 RepID=UPI0004890EE4|nr:LemA family protein [Mycoplasmopsis lipofaciens]